MDKELAEGAKRLYADNIFQTVRRCYNEANKTYLQKQLSIASEYLTDEQKAELRGMGALI